MRCHDEGMSAKRRTSAIPPLVINAIQSFLGLKYQFPGLWHEATVDCRIDRGPGLSLVNFKTDDSDQKCPSKRMSFTFPAHYHPSFNHYAACRLPSCARRHPKVERIHRTNPRNGNRLCSIEQGKLTLGRDR